jgi:hypothetical protein
MKEGVLAHPFERLLHPGTMQPIVKMLLVLRNSGPPQSCKSFG